MSPLYICECVYCGGKDLEVLIKSSETLDDTPCPRCSLKALRKDYSKTTFGIKIFKPHYNRGLGCWVENNRDIKKRMSELQKSNFPIKPEPVD